MQIGKEGGKIVTKMFPNFQINLLIGSHFGSQIGSHFGSHFGSQFSLILKKKIKNKDN